MKLDERQNILSRTINISRRLTQSLEMKTTMSDIKNMLDGKNSRIDTTEEINGELKDIVIETI